METYYPYSAYLKKKYGEKVYKLPINIAGTCPNRDGTLGTGGCDYCAQIGAGFESLDSALSVEEQLMQNKAYIGKRYGAKKFIPYFQNYTGTYLSLQSFIPLIKSAILPDMVCINISTRPDCVSDDILIALADLKKQESIDMTLELGLQTANYHTLNRINRGHGLAEFIDAVLRIKRAGLSVSAHVMLDLPDDSLEDVIETARILSALQVDGAKLHSLYIAKNSAFEDAYKQGKITLYGEQAYITRAIAFLTNLSPNIYIERLLGRVPKEHSVTANFNRSWWAVRDDIINQMQAKNLTQGCKFNYLNGAALKNLK